MKKAFKTIFIYLGVLLLALIATVIFCAGFLFFYRNGNIFGIQYISTNEILMAREDEDMSGLETIEVNSGSFDVYVRVNSSVSNLVGAMKNKVFGYAKKSKTQAKFEMEYDETSKTAVFSSVEPKGWLNKKDSYVEIAIPMTMSQNGCNVVVKTSKGDIVIGGDKDLSVGDLLIDTNKGDVKVINIDLDNNIDVSIGSGSITINQDCTSSSAIGSKINLGSGKVDYSRINTANFSFGTIEIKSIKRGKIGIKKAEELITDGNVNGGGSIEIGEVSSVYFSSLDTNISINHINGNGAGLSNSVINITGHGKVFVNNAECNLEVNGYNGDIHVKTSIGSVSLFANQGDIKMDSALKTVAAATTYGNINIQFSDAALDYVNSSTGDNNRKVIASTENGHIIVKGLQNGSIVASRKGRISLEYDKVVGQNTVSAQSGAVNIIVPNPTNTSTVNEFAFNLQLNSEINYDIKVGVVGSIGAVNYNGGGFQQFTNIYNSGTSTANDLNVSSTTGIIKIRSMDLVGF